MATQNPFNNFLNSKGFQNGLDIASTIADVFPNLSNFNSNIGDRNVNSTDALTSNIRSGLISTASKLGPVGAGLAAGLTIVDKTGGFSDASEGLGWGLDTANFLSSILLPGAGYIAPKTDTLELDNKLASSGSYTGISNDVTKTSKNANSRLLVGSNFVNGNIAKAKFGQNESLDILREGEQNKSFDLKSISNRNQMSLKGGFNPMYNKKGAKIENLDRAKKILACQKGKKVKNRSLEELIEYSKEKNPRFIQRLSEHSKGIEFTNESGNKERGSHLLSYSTIDNGNAIVYPLIQEINGELVLLSNDNAIKTAEDNNNYLIMTAEEADNFTKNYKQGWPEFFQKFKEGGSINVIPDGALHARKHHLENIDEKYKEVTNKGIPVISETESGEITQHAEVEKEEIIFRLEVTKKLEELAKENTDESAIEAGKLLVQEILYNTEDNTNKLL